MYVILVTCQLNSSFEFSVEQKNLNIKIFAASPDDVRGLFPYRMWAQIESDILHLKLNSDLASILSKGSTYKTTGVSRESYDALQVMLEVQFD